MNSFRRRRESKLIRISSKDRVDPSEKYNINVSFDDNFLNQITHVIVKSIVIPNTQYNVTKYTYRIFYDAGSGETSLTVPVGQYDLNSLIAAVETKFGEVGIPLTIIQDETTLKLNMTFGIPVFLYGKSTLAHTLGWEFDSAFNTVHELPNLPDLSGLQKVYIKSNKLSNDVSMVTSDKKQINIFTEVDVDVPFGGIVHRVLDDLNTSDEVTNRQPNNISSIDIELLDQNLDPVDLNGHDFEIILKVFSYVSR